MLDDFEPDAVTSQIDRVLRELRDALVPLVAAIGESRRRPDVAILTRRYDVAAQERLSRDAAARLGFDFSRGRLDETAHPFCTELGPHDCRITTRYDEEYFNCAFFGTLHEAGHGMYDQGLRRMVRAAAGRSRFAGHPRIAIAAVGKPRGPQPRFLALLFPRRSSDVP